MASITSTNYPNCLEHLTGHKSKVFDLDDPKYHLTCFYCGRRLGDQQLALNFNRDDEHDPTSAHLYIICPCGYRKHQFNPVFRNCQVDRVKFWKAWWSNEQKQCWEQELVPKWLKDEYST